LRQGPLNTNELSNPHNHQYNPDNIPESNQYDNANWMFKKESLRRVPVNLYNPTTKVEAKEDPGPSTYFKRESEDPFHAYGGINRDISREGDN